MIRCLLLFLALVPLAAQQRPPNILLIVSDDQGYNDVGAYGSPDIKTPTLDKLASEGVRLTSYYAGWPACTPSRGAMLTGRYPQRNGTYDNFRNDRVDEGYRYPDDEYALSPERVLGMDTREVLLSQVLKSAGYATAVFGKWDLGSLRRFLPLQRGFDDFYGFVNTGIDFWTHERYGVPSMYRRNKPTTADKGTYTTYLFEREALRFIDRTVARDKDQPFFIYLAYNAPHGASSLTRGVRGFTQAPGKYLDMYPDGDGLAARKRKIYMAAVTAMDDSISRVLARVDQHGLRDDTLVIFVSDNGGSSGADNTPLRGHKSQTWEGGVRVPAIFRWPGVLPAGETSDAFLSALEIFPTAAHAAGADVPAGVAIDGYDALATLQGAKPSPREEIFFNRRGDYGARVGKWKLVSSRDGGGLFDLSEDIGEKRDLSKDLPDVKARLEARYRAWEREMDQAEPRGPYKNF